MASDAEYWRSWSENAAPRLLEDFQSRTVATMKGVRRRYGPNVGPNHPAYLDMRFECHQALNRLAHSIEEEHNAEY